MIAVDDLTVQYGPVTAASGVRLNAAPGTTIGLVGPNGSGKSTVLRAILGAVKRAGGTVAIDNDDIEELSAREMSRRLAAVAQEEPSGLPLTAWDCVILGRSIHISGWSSYRDEDRAATEQAMRQTGVQHLAHRQISELSGGERQRVLIARALAQAATHLLLDEPTNHLDVRYQHEILSLVATLPLCTIVVLHDLNLAGRYCDELVLLSSGRVIAHGAPDEVLRAEILEPVYQIDIRRIDFDGVPQLAFAPRIRSESAI